LINNSPGPTFSIQGLCGLLGGIVVTLEDRISAEHNLSAREGLVLTGVVHRGDILELDLDTQLWGSDLSSGQIATVAHAQSSGLLSLTISLIDISAEADAEEIHNIRRDGGGPRDDVLDLSTQAGTNGTKDELVPESVLQDALLEVGLLGIVGALEEESGDASLGLDTGQDLVVDAVEETGHRGKDGGLEDGNIVQELESVSLIVTDASASGNHDGLAETLKDVGQGKVGNVSVVAGGHEELSVLGHNVEGADGRDKVLVAQDGTPKKTEPNLKEGRVSTCAVI
jgi:hypothetical protein